jgi:hypothetical protein
MKMGKPMYVFKLVFVLNTATKYEHLTQHLCFRLIYSHIRSLTFVCSHQLELAS